MVTISQSELDKILARHGRSSVTDGIIRRETQNPIAKGREISFTVLGNPVSANRVTRRVGNKSLKSKEAREYQARVARASFGTMLLQGQAYFSGDVTVSIVAINIRIDVDNISKTVLDGMQKVVYLNDRCVSEIHVVKQKDIVDKTQRLKVHVYEEA